jgi:hypothetical protein
VRAVRWVLGGWCVFSTHITGQGARPRPGSGRAHRPGFGRRGQHLAASLSVCPPPATTIVSCLYVYTYTCVHVCMCVCACNYVCMYVFSDVRIHIYTNAHIHMPHVSIYLHISRERAPACVTVTHPLINTHIYTCLYTSLSVHTHTCVYTYVHTYGCKNLHVNMCKKVCMCVCKHTHCYKNLFAS